MAEVEYNNEITLPPSGAVPDYFPVGPWFGFALKISRRTSLAGPGPRGGISVKQNGVKVAWDFRPFERVKLQVAGKLEKLTLRDFMDALKSGSLTSLRQKCVGLEFVLGTSTPGGFGWGIGVDCKDFPLILKGELSSGRHLGLDFRGKRVLQVSFGPTKAGWAEIIRQSGRVMTTRWLQRQTLGHVLSHLRATGAFGMAGAGAAALFASLGLVVATPKIAAYKSRKGTETGLPTYYAGAYVARILAGQRPRPTSGFAQTRLRQEELAEMGWCHAMNDARRFVAELSIALEDRSDASHLGAYSGALADKFGPLDEESGRNALYAHVRDQAAVMIESGDW